MKIMQILGGFCHWDASGVVDSLRACAERFAPDMVFVEAPDYVFEGWGYDPDAEGDARFIEPNPPEGWLYDKDTGTFYHPDDMVDNDGGIWDALAAAYREGVQEA